MADMYENRGWRVTAEGLEAKCAPDDYIIPAEDLTDTVSVGGTEFYEGLLHTAEKTWVTDFPSFAEAFREAVLFHGAKHTFRLDELMLNRSIEAARKRL
jgi:hypothetical protein